MKLVAHGVRRYKDPVNLRLFSADSRPDVVKVSNMAEARRKGKRPQTQKQSPQVPTVSDRASDALQTEDSQQEAFERELIWCIEQLEIGASNSKSKSTSQVHEAARLLKVLRNPKAPLVKKRQVMRLTFGDYRKKMEEDRKRYAASAKRITLTPADPAKLHTAAAFARKTQKPGDREAPTDGTVAPSTAEIAPDLSLGADAAGNQADAAGNEAFKFNFGADAPGDNLKAEGAEGTTTAGSVPVACQTQDAVTSLTEPALNYYKMDTANAPFAFNFVIPEET